MLTKNYGEILPSYIPRAEETSIILELATSVTIDKKSKVALLIGLGGVGKTVLLRNIATSSNLTMLKWLDSIDIDDSEYWLMPNLEHRVAKDLGQGNSYFQEYFDHILRLSTFESADISRETKLLHQRRSQDTFLKCYHNYISLSGLTPVILLDTIEALRGTDMLLNLTQWMKRLHGTFFVLAGRPSQKEQIDPLIREFSDPHQPLSYKEISISGFSQEQAIAYIKSSVIADSLTEEEVTKLTLLTQGYPLWLTLAVAYLSSEGFPAEIKENPLEKLKELLPYQADLPSRGVRLRNEFLNRLVVPYRENDFWSETIQRLAVVRQRVDFEIWQALMLDDMRLPKEVSDWQSAWEILLKFPWIRTRANRRYITLHDALAEALATTIIPLRDIDKTWRKRRWETAVDAYSNIIEREQQKLSVTKNIEQDTLKNEVYLLKAAHLYYQTLCNFEIGCNLFVKSFDELSKANELRGRELIWLSIQRLMGAEDPSEMLRDIISPVIKELQNWLAQHPSVEYSIFIRGCNQLIDVGKATEANQKITVLLEKFSEDAEKAYDMYNLRGNARQRISGQMDNAGEDFERALQLTQRASASLTLQSKQPQALKELGVYHRQRGEWDKSSDRYRQAFNVVPFGDRSSTEEMASIQANWAYTQALRGRYQDALDLVESSLTVRRRHRLSKGIALSLSIKGEILRYMRDFTKAWDEYRESKAIFEELGDWPSLGMINQEQAICLFQAVQAKEVIKEFTGLDEMKRRAQSLALQALDICRDWNSRAYPSALNRAGRIFGDKNYDEGIDYLHEGIRAAKEVSDGWFTLANTIEYVELNHKAWINSNYTNGDYRKNIESYHSEINELTKELIFPDLGGRWELLQGHLLLFEAQQNQLHSNETMIGLLRNALEHYKRGFPMIVRGYVGSHGASAVSSEFNNLKQKINWLPKDTIIQWCEELRRSWSDPNLKYIEEPRKTASLLAGLAELYEQLVHQNHNGVVVQSYE